MEEERLSHPWKLGCALSAVLSACAAGWMIYTAVVLSHDKSANSQLAMLRLDSRGVPLGSVQPAGNRWMKQAFVADASTEDGGKVAVLILDDHYRGGDPSYRSESGVIGDRISKPVLCSVPSQARTKNVSLDPAVRRLIAAECRQAPV
jgi:hypothetical protein